ncbi:MAG: trypsin-like serine protease [Clostridia bacterium]|nr:MAG: trypsin-like serine protease [Clostridia bacterium]
MGTRKRNTIILVVIAFLLGAAVTAVAVGGGKISFVARADTQNQTVTPAEPLTGPSSPPGVDADAIANIVDRAGPAVVKIDTRVEVQQQAVNPFLDDPFFRQFFGDLPFSENQSPQVRQGLGSGFLISKDGYILTNEHVVDGAKDIEVTVKGYDKPLPAKIVGSDYDLDLAVLKVAGAGDFSFLQLGDSDKVRVGQWVIAIGNPFGLDHTVTVGVISAKGRPITVEDRHYENLVQTDASINPGNSGGPLLNLQGEVVGINTAVNAAAQGIGFAIPASTAKGVVDTLITKGHLSRPWLGVGLQAVTPELAAYFGLEKPEGALINEVAAGSPAQGTGLRRGDVVLEVNGQKVKSPEDLSRTIQQAKIGQKMTLLIWRNGNTIYKGVTIAEKPNQLAR